MPADNILKLARSDATSHSEMQLGKARGSTAHELGFGFERFPDASVNLAPKTLRVGALCGIRATGKYFPLARRRHASRVNVEAGFLAPFW